LNNKSTANKYVIALPSSKSVTAFVSSTFPNNRLECMLFTSNSKTTHTYSKRYFAHIMQWIGDVGLDRMVQTGYVLGATFG